MAVIQVVQKNNNEFAVATDGVLGPSFPTRGAAIAHALKLKEEQNP